MLTIRRDEDIHEEHGDWFHARWHFSFDRYRDPEQMGVGALRVFNDDRIVPGSQWPMHPHRDIESLTYVVEGLFEHADSLGNGGTLESGGAQVMRFGSRGARHAERNGSDEEPLRFIQFWILPSREGLISSVQQEQFTRDDRTDRWLTIMSPAGETGLDLAQDARAAVTRLPAGSTCSWTFHDGRGGYAYVIDGAASLGGDKVTTGDAAKVFGDHQLTVEATEHTELILIDVPLEFEPVGMWKTR